MAQSLKATSPSQLTRAPHLTKPVASIHYWMDKKLHEITLARWSEVLQEGLGETEGKDEALVKELSRFLGGLLGG